MFDEYLKYWLYFFVFLTVLFSSMLISVTIMNFLKHLGYPQTKKTKWHLTWVIFTIVVQLGVLSYVFHRVFLNKGF